MLVNKDYPGFDQISQESGQAEWPERTADEKAID